MLVVMQALLERVCNAKSGSCQVRLRELTPPFNAVIATSWQTIYTTIQYVQENGYKEDIGTLYVSVSPAMVFMLLFNVSSSPLNFFPPCMHGLHDFAPNFHPVCLDCMTGSIVEVVRVFVEVVWFLLAVNFL